MKKQAVWLATAAASLALVSCGGRGEEGASSMPRIGMAIYKFDDTFMSGLRRVIEGDARGKAIITSADSQNQQVVQNDQVDTFLTQGVKSLIINPVDRSAAGVMIDKARADNVPVVFINREPEPADMAKWNQVYYVGANASDSGRMAAEMIVDYFKSHPEADLNGDGILQYVILMGEPGHQDAIERTAAYKKVFAESGLQTQLVIEDYANWNRITGQEKMAAFITYAQSHDLPIEAVLANNDDMALGAIEALRAAGYFRDGKFIPVVGVDASSPALDSIAKGELLGSALNDIKGQGTAAFEIAYALAKGEPIHLTIGTLTRADGTGTGNYVWVPYRKVTQDNYLEFR
jgi:methyl-galactoside transport system substrate-binding protein